MSKKNFKSDETLVCPSCGDPQTDEGGGASDFVIPGVTGDASAVNDTCQSCNEEFEAWAEVNGTISVRVV